MSVEIFVCSIGGNFLCCLLSTITRGRRSPRGYLAGFSLLANISGTTVV